MVNQVQETISREAADIENAKIGMMGSAKSLVDATNLNALQGNYLTPNYNVAGMSPDQLNALAAGRQGIGAYQPYLGAAGTGLTAGQNTIGEAADVLRGADTRGQFGAAQTAYNQAASANQGIGALSQAAGAGSNYLNVAGQGLQDARAMANQYAQGDLGASQGTMLAGAAAGQQAARLGASPTVQAAQFAGPNQTGFDRANAPSLATHQVGGPERVGVQDFTQGNTASQFMNPYIQNVVDIQQREAQRSADIATTQRRAQQTQAGAFGGSRGAIMDAEAARNLATQKGDIQAQGLNQAFQQAQQQFNTQNQLGLAAQQANQGAGISVGGQNLGAALQTQGLAAGQNLQAQLANQQAGLNAGQFNANMGYNTAQSNAQLQQQANLANQGLAGQYGLTQGQLGLQAAQNLSNVGQSIGSQNLQNAQLGQSAANLGGNLASQQGNLAGQYANIAGQQANILGQQSQLDQALGQGIGNLAGQQFSIGAQTAQGLGSLGSQQVNTSMQKAALGQQAQALGQQDSNFLYNLGTAQQKQTQAELDAARQNTTQKNMQPYQQMGFLSDIYRGAPSSQMSSSSLSQAAPSPFQQAAGLGIAGLSAAAAGTRAGII